MTKTNITVLILFILHFSILGGNPRYIKTCEAIEDLEQMVNTFELVHFNPYFKTDKSTLQELKSEYLMDWDEDSITCKEFVRIGMKLSALMSGGHSQMDWQNPLIIDEIKAHYYIPFSGKLNPNNQFVVSKSTHPQIKKGDIVVAINGIGIDKLYQECMSYIGGLETYKNASCEKIFPLYLFFNSNLNAPFDIKLGNTVEIKKYKGLDISETITFINASQPKSNYSFQLLENNTGLISYNSCLDYKKFKRFLKSTFQTIQAENIDKLIIDIRSNSGGNSSLNDLLLSYITTRSYNQSSGRYWKVSEHAKNAYQENKIYKKIFGKVFMEQYQSTPVNEVIVDLNPTLVTPKKPKNFFEGKTCMLIGPDTFSSANFLADAVKTYRLTTLIGQPTGEYTNDFGEQLHFNLKHSHSRVYISSTFDIAANGNSKILAPVIPDIEVHTDALLYAEKWINGQ